MLKTNAISPQRHRHREISIKIIIKCAVNGAILIILYFGKRRSEACESLRPYEAAEVGRGPTQYFFQEVYFWGQIYINIVQKNLLSNNKFL